MPGVSIADNSVIAAGSIVTKSIPSKEVWGGVPAKFIMTIEEYKNKLKDNKNKFDLTRLAQNREKEIRRALT